MDNIEVYGFEDKDGNESTFTTQDIGEAKEFARANNLRLMAYIFEFADTELVEDNTKSADDDNEEDGDDDRSD